MYYNDDQRHVLLIRYEAERHLSHFFPGVRSLRASLSIVQPLELMWVNVLIYVHRLVKLTSPNLNYFIILGALFLYAGAVFRVTPSTSLDVWVHVCRVSCKHRKGTYMTSDNFIKAIQ